MDLYPLSLLHLTMPYIQYIMKSGQLMYYIY